MAKYDLRSEFIATNAEGIQKIPQEWQIKQVRYLLKDGAEGIKIGPFGSALKLEDMVEEGFSVYGQENVIKKDFTLGKRKISETKFHEMSVYRIFPKDILITMMGTSGKCEIVPKDVKDGIIDSHLLRVRVKENHIIPEFFKLLIDESPEIAYQIQVFGKGSIMHGLNSGIVKSLNLPLPSIAEQKHILSFLDHETAKIDHLIEKQQQLIELLKEKRQAVISHAVTKGLDPNVPMKDSGVEWLGEVPEHWVTSKLKYYTNQIVDGAHFTPTYVESGVPFLRVTDIHNDEIDMGNIKYIPESEHQELIKRCKPEIGDLLLSKNGTIGVAKLVNWDWQFSIFVSLCLIKFKKRLMAEFAEYFFKSYEIQEQIFGLIKKSTVINLHLDKIQNFWFSIPPIDEQKEIVRTLDEKTKELNTLILKAESAIQLMQERRTALISAAVTGKIDVRNWQAPTVAEADTEFSA
ncbi:restriction endonuclease subunit S [Acinetobacter baumannii]|uniref:restriction endonuclease subunit S n=1 Tax=Acinetobacter baumannii TaxID=470 RepID=UPI001C0692BE|nr:restriction endonuclease subunit S [Acinetobacter baumannii]